MSGFYTRDRMTGTDQRLIMMRGFSRTGKSTIANELARSTPMSVVVSSDDIRRSMGDEFNALTEPYVHAIRGTMIRSLLMRGYTVICDETNLRREHRDSLRKIGESMRVSVRLVSIKPDLAEGVWKEICEKDNFPWQVVQGQILAANTVDHDEIALYDGFVEHSAAGILRSRTQS